MRRLYILIIASFLCAQEASAFTKQEALACVSQGVEAFMKGKPISHMVDVPFMMDRENLSASEKKVRNLIDASSRENLGYYRKVDANVVGQPQEKKKSGFFQVAGNVWGEETKSLEPGEVKWEAFSYRYTLWVRKSDNGCLIGVLSVEEWFRLGGWVKTKL